jgi:3-mercaptopyruvate sulfurtransferase SseA
VKKKISYIIALSAVFMTVIVVWYSHRPFEPKQATWEDVIAEAKAGGYKIITTEELRDRYQEEPSDLLMIDVRQEWEYRTGHIKGSLNFPMEPTWWARWRKADELEAFLGQDKQRDILFY